jgi:hypothetical protein
MVLNGLVAGKIPNPERSSNVHLAPDAIRTVRYALDRKRFFVLGQCEDYGYLRVFPIFFYLLLIAAWYRNPQSAERYVRFFYSLFGPFYLYLSRYSDGDSEIGTGENNFRWRNKKSTGHHEVTSAYKVPIARPILIPVQVRKR